MSSTNELITGIPQAQAGRKVYVNGDGGGTLLSLNSQSLVAGDTVILSGTFRETFAPNFSGTVDNPIIITSEGNDKAVISCCEIASGWAKTDGYTNIYEFAYTEHANNHQYGLLLEDKVRLTRERFDTNLATTLTALDGNAQSYYFDETTNKYYLYITGGTDPDANSKVYEHGARHTGILTTIANADLIFKGIEVYGADGDTSTYGNLQIAGTRINLYKIKSHLAVRHGIQFLNSEYCNCYDSLITDCEGVAVSMFNDSAAASTCISCTIDNSKITDSNGLVTIHGVDDTDNPPTNCGIINCEMDFNNIASNILINGAAADSTPKGYVIIYKTSGFFLKGCSVSGTGNSNSTPFAIGITTAGTSNVGVKIEGNQIDGSNFSLDVDWFYVHGGSDLNVVEFTGNYFVGDNSESVIRSLSSSGINQVTVKGNTFKDLAVAFHTDAGAETHWVSDYNVFNGLTAQANNSVGTARTFAQWTTETGNNDVNSINA